VVKAHSKAFEERQEKAGMNCLLLLAHLYNLKIVHCTLIYDMVSYMCDNFNANAISSIHLVLKNVGLSLRSDDPRALKEMIIKVQARSSETGVGSEGRERFLLEMVYNLKNNKAIGGGAEIFGGEKYVKQHDGLKHLRIQSDSAGKTSEPMLQVSRAALLDATKGGKWWLHGQIKLEKESHTLPSLDSTTESNAKVLAMARKCHMNTDVRKAIFCVIMTSEDYMDCVERLNKLNLKGKQSHEIPRVVMTCLRQERVYNPYYACIAQKLCKDSRSSTFTFTLCLWDAVKDLETAAVREVSHLARFFAHLIGLGNVPLSALKCLAWENLPSKELLLANLCVGAILTTVDEEQVVKVFKKIKGAADLDHLVQGLQLYLKQHINENAAKVAQVCGVDEIDLLKKGKIATRVLRSNTQDTFEGMDFIG